MFRRKYFAISFSPLPLTMNARTKCFANTSPLFLLALKKGFHRRNGNLIRRKIIKTGSTKYLITLGNNLIVAISMNLRFAFSITHVHEWKENGNPDRKSYLPKEYISLLNTKQALSSRATSNTATLIRNWSRRKIIFARSAIGRFHPVSILSILRRSLFVPPRS